MKEIIQTNAAPSAIGAYSQAVRVDKVVYLSGQIPLDPSTGALVSEDFSEQATQVFRNLQAVIEASGGSFDHVVKLNAYLTDLNYFSVFNEIMSTFMKEPFPARAAVGVASLPKGALLEVEAILMLD